MYGLMATVASSALAIVATGHLGADPDAVSVGAAAVAVAVLARALPLPTPASVVVALLAAAGAGIAVGQMTGIGAQGALLGAGAAVCALIGHRVASYDYTFLGAIRCFYAEAETPPAPTQQRQRELNRADRLARS
jgi:hypothetical protein